MMTAVNTHAGEPMRVITGGVPHIPGSSVFEKMKWLETKGDDLRLMMLREPRGYPSVCCNLIAPPCHPDADAGFILMEQTEYPAMSGGNIISFDAYQRYFVGPNYFISCARLYMPCPESRPGHNNPDRQNCR